MQRFAARAELVALILASTIIPASGQIPASAPASAPVGPPTSSPASQPIVVAIVNGFAITSADVDAEIARTFRGPPALREQAPRDAGSRERALKNLIDARLLDEALRANNVSVSPEDVRQAADDELVAFLAATGVERGPFSIWLRLLRNETLDDFLKRRAESEGFATRVRILKLIGHLTPDKLAITDEEIRGYYDVHVERYFTMPETVRARLILIRAVGATPAAKDEARAKAEGVLAEARAPDADFAALAQRRSDDPSAQDGGDLGAFPRERALPKALADAAFDAADGSVSNVIELPVGFAIVQTVAHAPATPVPFEAAQPGVRYRLLDEKLKLADEELFAKLRAEAKIEYPAGSPTSAPTTGVSR